MGFHFLIHKASKLVIQTYLIVSFSTCLLCMSSKIFFLSSSLTFAMISSIIFFSFRKFSYATFSSPCYKTYKKCVIKNDKIWYKKTWHFHEKLFTLYSICASSLCWNLSLSIRSFCSCIFSSSSAWENKNSKMCQVGVSLFNMTTILTQSFIYHTCNLNASKCLDSATSCSFCNADDSSFCLICSAT